MASIEDRVPSLSGTKTATFRADDVKASQEFRKAYESKLNVVHAEDMPWEHCADGLIKHLVHQRMNTREMFVVRRIVQGEGVERKFPLHSPRIADIVVKRSGKVRPVDGLIAPRVVCSSMYPLACTVLNSSCATA